MYRRQNEQDSGCIGGRMYRGDQVNWRQDVQAAHMYRSCTGIVYRRQDVQDAHGYGTQMYRVHRCTVGRMCRIQDVQEA